VFIFGFKYCKEKEKKGRMLNLILGQAKMTVYISRKCEIAGSSKNVELLFNGLIKARIKHDFIFYSHMKKLTVQRMLCRIENDTLHFIEELD